MRGDAPRTRKKINPAEAWAGFRTQCARKSAPGAFRSVADLDTAEAPAVTVPETLANHPARGRSFLNIDRLAIGRAAGGDRTADDSAADQSCCQACGDATLCACRCRGKRTSYRCNRHEGSKCLLHVLGSPGDGVVGWRRV